MGNNGIGLLLISKPLFYLDVIRLNKGLDKIKDIIYNNIKIEKKRGFLENVYS